MDNCFLIVNKIAKNKAKDHISLSYDERFLRRKKLISDNKVEFLVNLPETISLKENSSFVLENGSFILIKYAKEPLLEIVSENLMKIVWHIGNRHIPCQIELDRLLIQEDKVIEELIIKLGGKIKKIHEEFCPEGGAYGLGRTHGHKH